MCMILYLFVVCMLSLDGLMLGPTLEGSLASRIRT